MRARLAARSPFEPRAGRGGVVSTYREPARDGPADQAHAAFPDDPFLPP